MTHAAKHTPPYRYAMAIATPVTVAVGLVIAVSGVLLFFDLCGGYVRTMHEWLGIAFLAAAGIHTWRNWAAMRTYMKKPLIWVMTAAAVCLAIVLAVALGPTEGHPIRRRGMHDTVAVPAEQSPAAEAEHSDPIRRQRRLRGTYPAAGTADRE